jgi:hypothetical protein
VIGVRLVDIRVEGGPALEARRNGVAGLGFIFSNRPNRCTSLKGVSLATVASSFTIEFRGVIRGLVGPVPEPDAAALIAAFSDAVTESPLGELR